MRPSFILTLCLALLAGTIAAGCKTTPPNRNRPAAALQLQKSLVLSGIRYASILKALETGNLDESKKDIDWWIDQVILELEWLEEHYPLGSWDTVQGNDVPALPMKDFYRRIAQFRRDHPRQHSVPLTGESLKQINAFVRRYQ